MMNLVLRPLLGKKCFVYIDDIIIFSSTKDGLLVALEEVFGLLA